jgi:nitroimidazol reductase NimA-like FMN-containing flavoprotein (pyridoxamine 5'-phosphate oxidase superfamily)
MTLQGDSVHRATLTRETCVNLLDSTDLARVVISVRCLPAALPARIAVIDDDHLLLASAEESVILAARRGDVLSVEVDGLEPDGATWSVMASGLAALCAGEQRIPTPLRKAVDRGAALITLPLSVVVGERIE